MEFISLLAVIMLFGLVGGLVALRLKLPVLVGYIFGGAIAALLFSDSLASKPIDNLGSVGVALLLFSIGIEFSVKKLLEVKKYAVAGGVAQILLTMLLGYLVFPMFGFSGYEALFLGSVFAMSSTVVVVKILEDIGQIETHAGEIAIGWLILQDIAVVFLIVFLGAIAKGNLDATLLFESVLKSLLLIALAMAGRRILPRVLTSISKLGSREILVVTAFAFCIFFAFIAEQLGVSFTLGAFLAGIMISDSFLHHEIFSEIKPLQNIFAVFFFIAIGSMFSFQYLLSHLPLIVIILILVTLGKAVLVLLINLVLKMHIRNAIEVSISLANVGEFAFLSSRIAVNAGWISQDLNNLIMSVTIFSMVLAPLLITHSDQIYEGLRALVRRRSPRLYHRLFMATDTDIESETDKLKHHIIICGYGRVGKYVVLALRKLHYKLVVIEFNTELVEEAKSRGIDVIYGDATSEEILLQAGILFARSVIVALPKEAEILAIAEKITLLNPEVPVIIRKHGNTASFASDNSYSVVEPEFEAAFKIMERMLHYLGKRDKKVLTWLREQKDILV